MYKFLRYDTTDETKRKYDFETQLQCRKSNRTYYTECGVRRQLLIVVTKKCEMDINVSSES
jgi:hypothetical protein